MARGFCVDCNYEGALEPNGDCPRCGSNWTSGTGELHDEDQLEGLDQLGGISYSDSDSGSTDYYEL